MSHIPENIDFRWNTQHVPKRIPAAVEHATTSILRVRQASVEEFGVDRWNAVRQAGRDARLQGILNLDRYLPMLEEQVTEAGGHVHWARDAEEVRDIVLEIAREHAVKRIVKSKSMATEEIGLNNALQKAGFTVMETDLGEYILQLADQTPSHLTAPALHMTKEDIGELFHKKLGIEETNDPRQLTEIAGSRLREYFLTADMGISGANFLVAETGTLVLVTNEGNGRMCTTLPPLLVSVAAIDKVVPDWDSLAVLLELLPRSCSGQKLTTYTSFITGLRGAEEGNGPAEFHLILMDNGRTKVLSDAVARESLICLRCAACLNVCPVFNMAGGHAYGWTYCGPIGAVLTSQLLGTKVARDLPFASSLCGACSEICPVRIPIPELLLHLRHRVVEGDALDGPSTRPILRLAAHASRAVFGRAWLYRICTALARIGQTLWVRDGWLPALPTPMNRWTMSRPLPAFRDEFHRWWRDRRQKR